MTEKEIAKARRKRVPKKRQVYGVQVIEGDQAAALGTWPITLDPIFSGLAWALIFGLFASTLFTLIVVPVAYYSLNRKRGVRFKAQGLR